MSTFDDYPQDMRDPLGVDDATAEALLAGRPTEARADLAAVETFIAELRECRRVAVPAPSPPLATLFREGTEGEEGAEARAPVVAPEGRPRTALSGWRQRLAAAGLGLGAALTGVVGATAADLVPGPVERVVEAAVETLTPLEMPDERNARQEPGGEGSGDLGGEAPGGGGHGGPDAGGDEDPGAPGGTSGPAGGAPAGPSPANPGVPGGPAGGPGSGGVAVPGLPAPPPPGAAVPPVTTTIPPTPSVTTPPVPGGTPTAPTTPTVPRLAPSDPIPLPR